MVRAPCCDKVGLKKGPWTPEEDKILVAYVLQHGHGNWRALPKLAGLLRCGKSCRLRWINYLKPDIKRGNFSREEEDAIIELHEKLGNKWSAIAAKLPGRTDNEIKNVWHTHLKKKLEKKKAAAPDPRGHSSATSVSTSDSDSFNSIGKMSPQPSSSSEFSSDSSTRTNTTDMENQQMDYSPEAFPEIDESFWSDALSSGYSGMAPYFPAAADDLQFQSSQEIAYGDQSSNIIDDGMDFWYDVFIRSGGLQELS